jgi:Domain of unknown function (DUF4365)
LHVSRAIAEVKTMASDSIPPESKHPTVGQSYSVEQRAIQLLKPLLPSDWLWRKQTPDFFVDYHIEVVERGEPTGRVFGLQIKGVSNLKRRKNLIRYRMGRKHLSYYRDNARLPIFVALVDTTKGAAYWLFAQKYLREQASKANLDNQNSLTLRFEADDSFSNLARFGNVLAEAERYLRELFPGSPAAAISERERALNSLDPDIGVKLSFQDGHEVLKVSSGKPLSLGFRTLKPEGPEAFQALIDHGEIFKAEVEIIPPDSPLFQELMPSGKGLIHFEPDPREGCVQIACGSDPVMIAQLNGKWRAGAKSARFEGRLDRSPLGVELRIDDLSGTPQTSFDTPFRLGEWEGQSFSRLAWFDHVYAFIGTLADGREFRIDYLLEGIPLGSFVATAEQNQSMTRLKNAVDWLEKCRFVANYYGVDAILPKFGEITYAQQRDVEALHALATGNFVEDSIAGLPFGFSGSAQMTLPESWQSSTEPTTGTLKLIGPGEIGFFGQVIEIPEVEQLFTDMELIEIKVGESSKSLLFKGKKDSVWRREKTK